MTPANFRVVIPARLGSTRLPRKPLSLLNGKPMIAYTIENAIASFQRVYLATDDWRIAEVGDAIGATVFMSKTAHYSGTERVAEVAEALGWPDDEIVVNLQGDEPTMSPNNIGAVAHLLAGSPHEMATLSVPLFRRAELIDPNIVKVVRRQDGRALYFSRAPITNFNADDTAVGGADRHIGIYAYRAGALRTLAKSPKTLLELNERLEQLRAMHIGMEIMVATAPDPVGPSVDILEDLFAAEKWLLENKR